MCEANVYLINPNNNQQSQLILESVDKIIPQVDGIYLENIFGERKTLRATIASMELVQHKIYLQQIVG